MQAFWVSATANTDIAIDPNPEWTAVHYTLDCAENYPALADWRTPWAAEVDRLDDITLNDTPEPQTMEPARRAARTHQGGQQAHPPALPNYHTPRGSDPIKEALSPTLPDTHKAHQPGIFTTYWNFPTDTGMVPQVDEPTLPPTVTGLAKATQAMVHR